MPEVSVIVPVFNTAAYIRKCVESVLSQSFRDIEVIIVDDGSTDGGVEIAKALAARDDRVKFLQTPRAGAGAARNLGMSKASGTFLMFVDSDDFLLPGAIESLHSLASRGCGFAYGGYDLYDQDGRLLRRYEEERRYLEGVGAELLPQYLTNVFEPRLGSFIVEKRLLDEGAISFPEGFKYGEDRYLIAKILVRCDSVKAVKFAVYGYVKRQGSAVQTPTFERFHHVDLLLKLQKELEDTGRYGKTVNTLKFKVIPDVIVLICYALHAEGLRWGQIRRYIRDNGYKGLIVDDPDKGVLGSFMLALWSLSPMLHCLVSKVLKVLAKLKGLLYRAR